MTNQNQSNKEKIGRVGLVFLFFAVLGFLVLAKVVKVQWIEGREWREKVDERTYTYVKVDPVRGNILASDGRLLSTSIPLFDVFMDIDFVPVEGRENQLDSMDYQLTKLFKKKYRYKRSVIDKYDRKAKGRKMFLIKRNVRYSELQKMRKFCILRVPGVMQVEKKSRRIRPFGELAARTIGFVNKDTLNPVRVGLEGAYDSVLQGKSTKQRVQKLSRGYYIPGVSGVENHGYDVVTNLDINIQDVAHSALKEQLVAQNAHHGTAIVMEVETGRVLACVNLGRDDNGNYAEAYNYAVGESTEPGSTFKLASMLVALEDGVIDPDDEIQTGNGVHRFHNRYMRDSHHGGFGTITATQCFEKSSNVGISRIIYDNYKSDQERFVEGLYDMGLHEMLGVDISGEGRPIIRTPESKAWSKVSLPWMSIGYEVAMTPLQILAFYNGIANDGTVMKPQFVRSIRFAGKEIYHFEPEVLRNKICSQSSIDLVKSMMEGVVEHGTARNIKNSIYKIAGKTGTAQIAKPGAGYNKTDYKASFAGYFPADNPKFSCIVAISNPSNGVYYGSLVSGAVFKEIADKLYATRLHDIVNDTIQSPLATLPLYDKGVKEEMDYLYMGLNLPVDSAKAQTEFGVSMPGDSCLRLAELNIREGLVPNVTGMGARDAVFALERLGLKVKLKGKGKVKTQSIRGGKRIVKGNTIVLTLK